MSLVQFQINQLLWFLLIGLAAGWLAHVWGEIAFCWPGAEWISSVFRGLLSKQPQIS